MAFRSVPRPSSPPGAKASTERPSHAHSHATFKITLEHPILHRNHPTRPSTCRTYPYPNAALARRLREQPTGRDGRAIKHIHSHTPLNTSGCGDLALTCLLRSDLQPARPDAPNPDSHVKRTKPALLRRPAHARPSPGSPRKGAAQCSHDLVFPPRRSPLLRSMAPYGGGRYRTDDPLLAKQVLSH